MKHKPGSVRGTAVVEFAFVLPLLLLIFFGIVEFSIALYDKAMLTNASRVAARAGSVYIAPGTRLSDDEVRAEAVANCAENMISFQGDAPPEVTITRTTPDDFPQGVITVRIDYSYTGLGLGTLLTAVTGPIGISATTTIKNE